MSNENKNSDKISEITNKVLNSDDGKTFTCQVCNKESKNSADAATHLLDHGSSALESVSTMIKDQTNGKVTAEEKADDSATPKKEAPVIVAKK
jgi:hypothetical protein